MIECIIPFRDRQNELKKINVGDVIERDEEREKQLVSLGYCKYATGHEPKKTFKKRKPRKKAENKNAAPKELEDKKLKPEGSTTMNLKGKVKE